jgi:hypothetical protein
MQTNRPPTARDDVVFAPTNDVTKILKSKLLANDTDPDLDPLTVIGYSRTSSNGSTIIADSTGLWLFFVPHAGATNDEVDAFTYTISDGFGGISTATVRVIFQAPALTVIPKNLVSAKLNNDGTLFLRFSAITGRQYKVQASTSFLNPIWVDLPMNPATVDGSKFTYDPIRNTITANDAGFIEYTDVDAPIFPTRFYRSLLFQ